MHFNGDTICMPCSIRDKFIWIDSLLHGGYNILLEDISSCNFVIQGAESMDQGNGSSHIFPLWHLRKSKKDCLCAFLASLSVSHPIFFFYIFAAHSLSPEVENLK